MKEFTLFKPDSIDELLELKQKYGEQARIMAGGTDLIVNLEDGDIESDYIIYIGNIKELKYIKEDEEGLHLGPLTTISELCDSKLVMERLRALYEAARVMANQQVRNIATIGGNICNASPAGDTLAPLMVLGAKIKAEMKGSFRWLDFVELFTGVNQTSLRANEVLTDILIPVTSLKLKSSYKRIGTRKASSIAIAGCAVSASVVNKKFEKITVAFSSLGPTVILANKLGEILLERELDEKALTDIEKNVPECITPITDKRGSKWYREQIASVLAKQVIGKAYKLALEV